jgi:hypothetical protein
MMDMYLGILTATRFMPLFLLLSALVGPTAHRKDVEVSAEARKWDNYCTVPAGSSNFTCRISIS